MPARILSTGKTRFELMRVVPGWANAKRHWRRIYDDLGEPCPPSTALISEQGESSKFAISAVSDQQIETWPELEPHREWRSKADDYFEAIEFRPYIIWKRTD